MELETEHILLVGAAPTELTAARDLDVSRYSYVVAVDGGAHWCMTQKVVPDVFVGDKDTVSEDTCTWLAQKGVASFTFPAHKDETDLSLALSHVIAPFIKAHKAMRPLSLDMVGFLGGKLDHELGVLGQLKKLTTLKGIGSITLKTKSQTVYVLAGRRRGFQNRLEAAVVGLKPGVTFSLVPLTRATVSEEGCVWNLKNKRLDSFSDLGISNVIESSHARIICKRGVCLVCVSRERGFLF